MKLYSVESSPFPTLIETLIHCQTSVYSLCTGGTVYVRDCNRFLVFMNQGALSQVWSSVTKAAVADAVLSLTKLDEEDRTWSKCLQTPSLWLALAALCLLQDEHVDRLSSAQWANSRGAINKVRFMGSPVSFVCMCMHLLSRVSFSTLQNAIHVKLILILIPCLPLLLICSCIIHLSRVILAVYSIHSVMPLWSILFMAAMFCRL